MHLSVDISFGLLQVFPVELGGTPRTPNRALYLIHGGGVDCPNSVNHNREQMLSFVSIPRYLLVVRIEPETLVD